MNVNRILRALPVMILLSAHVFADSSADKGVIDLSLYPPLSTGEASPWENPDDTKTNVESAVQNPWSAQQQVAPLTVQPYSHTQPQYNSGQYQYQYPYQQPQSGYYPNQGMIPVYPQMPPMPPMPPMPYGYGVPNAGYGGGYYPPNNGWYNNSGPFKNFSMPWPF